MKGRRRPGPNRWGFDPEAPRLEPPQRADNAHHVNRMAYEFWASLETHEQLPHLVHQFARRKRRGTRAEPVRRKRGEYRTADLEVRKRALKDDGAEGVLRLLAWCAWHADWRTGRVGLWRDGKMHYQSRCSLGDRAGFPARVDDKQRVRADQLDRRMEDAIAAGLLWRHEENGTMTLKVTRLFWIICGVQRLREIYGQREKQKAEQDAADWESAHRAEKARRRGEQRAPSVASVIDGLVGRGAPDPEEAARLRHEVFKIPRRPGGDEPPS